MESNSRASNSLRNISWGIVYEIVTVLLSFLGKTIIIRSIGIEYAGVSNLFTSIMSVLNMAELGLNSAIVYSMYSSVAARDTKRTNALLNYYRKAYLAIGASILFAGLLLCPRIDLFIAGDYPSKLNIHLVFLIFLANTVSSYLLFAYYAVILSANQREDIIYRNRIKVNLSSQLIQLLALIVFRDYYIFIIIALFATIAYNYLNYRLARKRYPEYVCDGTVSTEERKRLKKQITGLMIGKLSVVSRNSFDSIVISSFLGLTATAIYGNYYYIMSAVFGLIYHFCSGMKASIGNKIATGTVEENYSDLFLFSFAFYLIYGTCTVIMLCLYQPFIEIWVGSRYTAPFMLALLMSVYFFFYCATGIISQYWDAAGLFWENRYRYILEAVLNLVLNIILVKVFGLCGVILATIITMVFSANIYGARILFKHYFVGCSFKKYLFQQGKYLLCTVISCGLAYYLCSFITLNGIFGLFIRLIISGSVAVVTILALLFKTKECRELIARYGSLVKIKDTGDESIVKTVYRIAVILVIVIIAVCIVLTVSAGRGGS